MWAIAAWSFAPGVFGPYSLNLACGGGGGGACTPNATTLCLNNGRFRVTATFATNAGQSGSGMAVAFLVVLALVCVILVAVLVYVLTTAT